MGNGKIEMPQGVKMAVGWSMGLGILALVLLILLILFGNLSGNTGFATGSQGFNDTEDVILNFSKAATNTSSQFPTVGIIIGIALLLVVLIGILAFAVNKLLNLDTGGKSNASFG